MKQKFYDKTDTLIKQITDSFDEETQNIETILHESVSGMRNCFCLTSLIFPKETKPITVTFECTVGPHEGEVFHLSVRDVRYFMFS